MAPADGVKSAPVGQPDVAVFASTDALAQAAADEFVRCAVIAIRATGRFVVALAGGSTPAGLYALLATEAYARRVDWARVHVCWGDERCVPPDHPASNYRMARDALLDHVPVPDTHVHRMRGEDEPMQAAAAYERELRALFGTAVGAPQLTPGTPFDLVLLGMGSDGHTASLFPGTAAVSEAERWVVAHYVAVQSMWRITLTPVLINAAADVIFLVAGRDKAPALRRVLEGPPAGDGLPAQVIAPRAGRVRWLVDASAAATAFRFRM